MKRAVRTVIRLGAAGIIVIGAMYVGLEYVRQRAHDTEINLWRVSLGALGLVLGTVLFATSSRLAEKLTDDFEE